VQCRRYVVRVLVALILNTPWVWERMGWDGIAQDTTGPLASPASKYCLAISSGSGFCLPFPPSHDCIAVLSLRMGCGVCFGEG
jgi:hypothetical protein